MRITGPFEIVPKKHSAHFIFRRRCPQILTPEKITNVRNVHQFYISLRSHHFISLLWSLPPSIGTRRRVNKWSIKSWGHGVWRKKLHRCIWDGRSNKTCFIKPLSVKRIFGWVAVGDFMRCDALSGFWWAVYTPAVHIQMYSDQTNNLDFNTFYSTTAPVSKVIHGNKMNSPPPSVRRDLSSPFSSYTLHLCKL